MASSTNAEIAGIAGPESMAAPRKNKKKPRKSKKQKRRKSFAALGLLPAAVRSNTSLESEALLDHRDQRQSFTRPSLPATRHRPSMSSSQQMPLCNKYKMSAAENAAVDDDDGATVRTPLLRGQKPDVSRNNSSGYGSYFSFRARPREMSRGSASSSKKGGNLRLEATVDEANEDFDVNNPPSRPGSPQADDFLESTSPRTRDAVIDIDRDEFPSLPPDGLRRRATVAEGPEQDVCFPVDTMSEIADEDDAHLHADRPARARRRRVERTPKLAVLAEWAEREHKELEAEAVRSKRVAEPLQVAGRLRPTKTAWHRVEDDAPFRFAYFNETFEGTIHARNISDLVQDGTTFDELFQPPPMEFSSDSESDDENGIQRPHRKQQKPEEAKKLLNLHAAYHGLGRGSPATKLEPTPSTWWLDVLSPTEEELRVLGRTFGIHQLTLEDINISEQREKVELFSNYYFVTYRSFEQDTASENYMDPVNIYMIVFRDFVLTFHHSMTPHMNNVRRRIRQLEAIMSPTSDWICYALIDDITDVYAPLVDEIEDQVDAIDDEILYMHSSSVDQAMGTESQSDAKAETALKITGEYGGDMLRRVGECRKKVMGLYRLLGNKADVIKGFAKRCNERLEVAPRSEIGLYLGDIQDHIVTMTGNLSHYETLLSRSHSNYLAQINLKMNERSEKTADVLGKLTVLGTIVLPMNIITGMWGMNVWVPGQQYEGDLTWFWCITAGLMGFGLACYLIAKKVYGIV
ncbi:cora-domain-containing protein [Piedraia hortae CBS 480.64]|uniref:Cora-domain-containing protein n=1 Tax=Piedraia hortae CBS 480.64 TaxID=1314780 RepID=A0A6A7C6A4_9PEZI|nr:cora-domain-containing protein [Piedraia hortae CBS 480.64]